MEVVLYVYDLSQGMAAAMSRQLTGRQIDGIWHTSVVAFGVEVFFGQGISIVRPGTSHHGQPLRKVSMGRTDIDSETFFAYLDGIRETYSAERYHLTDFNCNTFTNDVVGFLTGGSIPRDIRELPADFLSTPFGASLRPMIDNMFRQASAGTVAPPNVPSVDVANAVRSNGATSLLQSVANQATSSRPLRGALTICTNTASFDTLLRDNQCVVVMFTSEGCPPCRAIKPAFENMAASSKQGAFVLVDTASGGRVASSRSIRATPTFQFFLRGEMVHELKGANQQDLRNQVDMLLFRGYPPHPHSKLSLPQLSSFSRSTVLHTSIPNFTPLLAKLQTSSLSPPSLAKYRDRIIPFLSSSSKASTPPADLVEHWSKAHADALSKPATTWFPAIDLLRLGFLHPSLASTLLPLLTSTIEEYGKTEAAERGRPTMLTTLKMLTNAFSAASLESKLSKEQTTPILIEALLEEDKAVRTAAAGLAVAMTRLALVRRRAGDEGEEEWEAEVGSALLEALDRESEGEVLHRLVAALGLLLLESAYLDALRGLCEALEAKRILEAKASVLKDKKDATALVHEVMKLL